MEHREPTVGASGGRPRTQSRDDAPVAAGSHQGQHAVVIGGSIAGLVAARVLASSFAQVTVIDRDTFPQQPTFRSGAPQGRHVHVLLVRGLRELNTLFPGLSDELLAYGVSPFDWIENTYAHTAFGKIEPYPSGLMGVACSRHLIEWTLHRRLTALPNVTFLEGHMVTGLLTDETQRRVTGVRLRLRNAAEHQLGDEEQLRADLVVDASGRDSQAPDWLAALGYERPHETMVNSFTGYASRMYRRPATHPDWHVLLIQSPYAWGGRGGVLYEIEDDQWIVTLGAAAKDYPPNDEAGFLAYTASLPDQTLHDLIVGAEPLSPIYGYRRMENRVRHFERLARQPEGLLVMGDAACCFNPIYGQGMTTATIGAELLDRQLRACRRTADGALDLTGLPGRYQRALAKANALPWLMATSEDFRYPLTVGGKPGATTRFMYWYIDRVRVLAVTNHNAYTTFFAVAHLVKPPTALFAPGIAARVLFRVLTGGSMPKLPDPPQQPAQLPARAPTGVTPAHT